jgi:hypothetical protein
MTAKWIKAMPRSRSGESLFAASNSAADAVGDANNLAFVTGGRGGSSLYHLTGGGLILDAFWSWPSFEQTTLAFPHLSDSQGAFSMAHRQRDLVTPPHGYRSAVAYVSSTGTWITVGPNGTDISTDDGRNWRALKPSPTDTPDADRNWNALSLPFVVGPHGRIGILRPTALTTNH